MDENKKYRGMSKQKRPLSRQSKFPRLHTNKLFSFFSTHRTSISTGILLTAIAALLIAICSLLQAPAMSDAPNGVTTVDYSTFVEHVKAGDVVAIAIRGNEVNALLRHSLSPHPSPSSPSLPSPTSLQDTQMYETWIHYIKNGNSVLVTPKMPVDTSHFIFTTVPLTGDAQLIPLLLKSQVKITMLPVVSTSGFLSFAWRFAPLLIAMLAILLLFGLRNRVNSIRQIDERITQIGKSRAKRFTRIKESTKQREGTTPKDTARPRVTNATVLPVTSPSVTFADVAGIDEVRTELEEIVQFLQKPERFSKLGAHIPRGALLVGPPGTGKTLLTKAVAGEANVPFFSMSASEFVEMFVGVGASRVRDLFSKARHAAPCVIFIDELDAVGRKRTLRVNGNDERDQTLNQLLVELDGFDTRHAVVVLAATNRVDILDKALLRPGRFDRHITISLPDRVGREAILKVHTRSTPLHESVSLTHLARLTTGMSGADLANLVNEASLSAARLDLEHVTHDCFEQALARVQLGALRPLVMSEKERRIIAYHEGGHALVAHHVPEADTVNRITILPRGQSLGVTHFVVEEDRYNYSRHMLMAKIAVGLGGRVAEELIFGVDSVTTGAENDLQVVSDLARRMVTRWGMSEEVGVIFAANSGGSDYSLNMRRIAEGDFPAFASSTFSTATATSASLNSDGTLRLNNELGVKRYALTMSMSSAPSLNSTPMMALIDAEVQRILNEGRDMARTILTEHRDQLLLLADTLMEHEQLDRRQFEALLFTAKE